MNLGKEVGRRIVKPNPIYNGICFETRIEYWFDYNLYLFEDKIVVDQGLRGNLNTPTRKTSKLSEMILIARVKKSNNLLFPLEK